MTGAGWIAAMAVLAQTAAPAVPAPWAVTTATSGATTTAVWTADRSARLVVRCDKAGEKIVSVQFIPKPGFAAATPRPVSLKADDGSWLGTNWQFPGNGAFTSDDAVVTTLAATIAHAKAIRVRVIDPADAVIEASFAGPPDEAPVRRVLEACGYTLGEVPPRSRPPAPKAAAAEDDAAP